MLYGTTITITPEGIRIPEEQLKPLGLFDGSRCWGVEVADRHVEPGSLGAEPALPHLVIAPFDLDSWPVMFRTELKLQLDPPHAMVHAAEVLHDVRFNILSIQKAPSGHHHTTVTAMGECDELKQHHPALDERPSPPGDANARAAMRHYVNERFAPPMLAYSRYLQERMLRRHEQLAEHGRGFLRETFVGRGSAQGVLYDVRKLPIELPRGLMPTQFLTRLGELTESIRVIGERQRTEAVSCVWLQQLAFFWLWRTARKAIAMRYDAHSGRIVPESEDGLARYRAVMQGGLTGHTTYPYKTIATLDLREHYLRIVRSPLDDAGRTAFANLEYTMRIMPPATTRGFQLGVYRQLAAAEDEPFVVRRVSSALTERSPGLERGWFHFLVSSANPGARMDRERLDRVQAILQSQCNASLGTNRMTRRRIAVEAFSARRLFLSTAFEWYDHQPRINRCIEKLAVKYGFRLVTGRTRGLEESQRLETLNRPKGLTQMITDAIDGCQAFVLLLPQGLDGQPTKGRWEFFELGWAVSRQIPHRICVQVDEIKLADWKQVGDPDFDQELIGFRLADGPAKLRATLEPAFEALSRPARAVIGTHS